MAKPQNPSTNDKALAVLAVIIGGISLPFAASGLLVWITHILHTQWTPAIPPLGYWTAFWVTLIWGGAKLVFAGFAQLTKN